MRRGTEREKKQRSEAEINILIAIHTKSCLSLQFQNNGGMLPMKNKTAASDTFYGPDFVCYTTREAKTILNA